MLFNSFIFLFVFLPLCLILFYAARKYCSTQVAIGFLVLASFIFYAYWNPVYLIPLFLSITFNYFIGHLIRKAKGQRPRKSLMLLGISANLGLLGYFKYTNFLIENLNLVPSISIHTTTIILPLAISFFTFQQIAYLVDTYRDLGTEKSFLNYCLFVSFFPPLIAGPIVHHKEMMPQFSNLPPLSKAARNISLGLALFSLGLFKKTVIADNFSIYANQLFDAPSSTPVLAGDAWIGALSYHFQIYFDFSGYSDMAMGLAYMFGILLPINFNSPYKAGSIIDFWRVWHMTLSRFLRDYLYITLGGNRKGKTRRHANLLITMLLGGIWHGAAWTFVVWGAIHGMLLICNHVWRSLLQQLRVTVITTYWPYRLIGVILTTLGVLTAWVYFRASDLESANRIILAMFGASDLGISISLESAIHKQGFAAIPSLFTGFSSIPAWGLALSLITTAQAVVLWAPNSMQLLERMNQPNYRHSPLRPELYYGALLSCSTIAMFGVSEFIYFQF